MSSPLRPWPAWAFKARPRRRQLVVLSLGWAGLGWSGQEASLGAWPCLAVSGAALVPVEWGVGSGVSSQSGSH